MCKSTCMRWNRECFHRNAQILTRSLILHVAGVSEGGRDLPAEAAAEGEPG